MASVLLRQVHYHIFKFLSKHFIVLENVMRLIVGFFFFILAHFNHLLNQGIPMPIQTGAQIPFLIVTYATIGEF